jgi:hypothetical protein
MFQKFQLVDTNGVEGGVIDRGSAIARGLINGESPLVIRGYNQGTSTTNELIWAQSGTSYPVVTSAQTLTISSSDIDDNSAGTGARTALVTYIQFSTGNEVTVNAVLNGRNPVQLTTDGYAVNDIRVSSAGTSNANEGTLYVGYGTVTTGVPANILASVVIGVIVGQQAVYTVPTGKALDLMSYRFSPSVLSFIQLKLKPSKSSGIITTEYDIPLGGAATFNSPMPSVIPSGYQIQIWARTSTGAGACGCIIQGNLRGA